MSEKLKDKAKLIWAICFLITIAIAIVYTKHEKNKSIDRSMDDMRQELQQNFNADGRKLEKQFGPYRCGVCNWVMSLRAKTCTNCGDPK